MWFGLVAGAIGVVAELFQLLKADEYGNQVRQWDKDLDRLYSVRSSEEKKDTEEEKNESKEVEHHVLGNGDVATPQGVLCEL